jgi:hypothetical protein
MATINDAKLIAAPYNFMGNTIYRFALPGYAADPGAPAELEIWHNNTDGKLRIKLPTGIKSIVQEATEIDLGASIHEYGSNELLIDVIDNILTRLDLAETGTGGKVKPAVQTVANLKALNIADADEYPDKCFILVEDSGLYRLDRNANPAATAEALPNVVLPNSVLYGVWYKISDRLNDHNMMTGLQGGQANQYYHLRQTAHEWVEGTLQRLYVLSNSENEYVELEVADIDNAFFNMFVNGGANVVNRITTQSKFAGLAAEAGSDFVTLDQVNSSMENSVESNLVNIVANTWTTITHNKGQKSIEVLFYVGVNPYELNWRYKAGTENNEIEIFSSIAIAGLTVHVSSMNKQIIV